VANRLAAGGRHTEGQAGRRLEAALSRAGNVPVPPKPWLPPEALTLVRQALEGVVAGLERRPPVVGTPAAGRRRTR
jgi:hypothetical protein